MTTPPRDTKAGAAVYNRVSLAGYDAFVLGLCNRYVWRCPSGHILELYQQHAAVKHLDVGVGTGYFLDKCHFPTPLPSITLADLNRASLEAAAKRIARYNPETVVLDVLESPTLQDTFDSVAVNYLLHCLPGTMTDKRRVFEHLKGCLNPGGVLFGATILGAGVTHNPVGRGLMRLYNKSGIFTNEHDGLGALEENLSGVFDDYRLELRGRVALFSAHA